MNEIVKILATSFIPATITGVVAYIVNNKNIKSTETRIQKESDNKIHEMQEQHKCDLEKIKLQYDHMIITNEEYIKNQAIAECITNPQALSNLLQNADRISNMEKSNKFVSVINKKHKHK